MILADVCVCSIFVLRQREGLGIMIEQNWADKTIYHVRFLAKSNTSVSNRKFCRTLVLPSDLSHSEVEKIVFEKFHNIIEVLSIDELSGGLLLL